MTAMFTLEDLLEGTGGTLDEASAALAERRLTFDRVAIDSRKALDGALFVALRGERSDGHDYVFDAAGHGARGALVRYEWQAPEALSSLLSPQSSVLNPHFALVRVEDPLAALQRFAAWWRARHDVQVIGITGSVGKTSTKEVTASVLSRRFNTLKSEGNLNNEIGLPLTL